ncbi:MAG: hypothetical protein ABSA72_07730 [Nitrososphaerales archaeon]
MTAPRTLYVVIVVLLAGMLISSTFAALYLYQYNQAETDANAYLSQLKSVQPTQETSILLDFGNGTLVWHNDTQVPTGANAYVATIIAARGIVNATYYPPPYAEHIVTGIDNVQGNQQESWFIWTYNATARWQVAQVGADELAAGTGSIFAWTYCTYSSATYVPSCIP